MTKNDDGDESCGILIVLCVSACLTGLGFSQMGWPWPFGALAGFFGAALVIKVIK